MKTILSFDCSSTTIGYSVLQINENNQINFVSCNYIKPPKKGNLIERIAQTRDVVEKVIDQVKPNHIAIEEIIAFMQGKSTAKTITMLTTFNRMICLLAYDYLHRPPQLYNVMSIRHGLKFNKVLPAKEDMPELIAKHLDIKFPYQYKKTGKEKIENQDMADSIAVGLYCSYILTNKIIPKIKTSKKKKVKKQK